MHPHVAALPPLEEGLEMHPYVASPPPPDDRPSRTIRRLTPAEIAAVGQLLGTTKKRSTQDALAPYAQRGGVSLPTVSDEQLQRSQSGLARIMTQTNIRDMSDLEQLVAAGSHDVHENLDWIRMNLLGRSPFASVGDLRHAVHEYGKSLREGYEKEPFLTREKPGGWSGSGPGAGTAGYGEYLQLFPEVEAQLVAEGFEPLPGYEAPEQAAPEAAVTVAREPDDVDAALGLLGFAEPITAEADAPTN
jgi:hypothetical protein